jgi:hypothetical protein
MTHAVLWEAVRRCVRDHDWDRPPAGLAELLAGRSLEGLVPAALAHGVASMVHLSLTDISGLESGARTTLLAAYLSGKGRHEKTLDDLREIATVFDANSVHFVVIKGPVLAELVYPRADLRAYADLDLVVAPESFGRAIDALRASGGKLIDPYVRPSVDGPGQLRMSAPGGTLVELHWDLVNDARVRHSLGVSTFDVLERAGPASLAGTNVRIPEPTDTLLHLAVHAGLAGASRLIWLKDVEQAARRLGHDWSDVVGRAQRWKAGDLVAVVLRRSRATLDAPVPNAVTQALVRCPRWQALVRVSERVSPPERSPASRTLTRAVTRATRSTLAASARALGGRLLRRRE